MHRYIYIFIYKCPIGIISEYCNCVCAGVYLRPQCFTRNMTKVTLTKRTDVLYMWVDQPSRSFGALSVWIVVKLLTSSLPLSFFFYLYKVLFLPHSISLCALCSAVACFAQLDPVVLAHNAKNRKCSSVYVIEYIWWWCWCCHCVYSSLSLFIYLVLAEELRRPRPRHKVTFH